MPSLAGARSYYRPSGHPCNIEAPMIRALSSILLVAVCLLAVRRNAEDASLAELRANAQSHYPYPKGVLDHPAKASARKGPVEITLEIAATRLHTTDGLWLRATIKNVGVPPFLVEYQAFDEILDLTDSELFRIEVLDAKGKAVTRSRLGPPLAPPICGKYSEEEERRHVPMTLRSNESISTLPLADVDSFEHLCLKRPLASPIPPYGEIRGMNWQEGKHRVRLVYRRAPKGAGIAPSNSTAHPDWVDVSTDWIEVRVSG